MALQQGETYRCPSERCGCETRVTRGAGPGDRDQQPQCCCGMEMRLTAYCGLPK